MSQIKITTLFAAFLLAALALQVQAQNSNLLTNPGFESPFTNQGGNPERQVANGWDAWHVSRSADQPDWQNTQPEYSETLRDDRIRSGNNAQRYESFFAAHEGGVFQVVSNIAPGTEVTFSAYVWVWSSGLDDEDISEGDGDVIVDVGIDPTGGTDGTSEDILWSVGREAYDEYNQYSVSAIAEGDTISVWVRSRVTFAVKTSRIYVDDASLIGVEQATTPDPTEEPTEPTEEPTTEVPTPTRDVVEEVTPPTSTPIPPTATNTPDIGGEFPNRVSYLVQRGDTLSRLATRFDSSVNAIQQANNLGNSTLIFVGQTLSIPVRSGGVSATATPTSVIVVITATPGGGIGSTNTYVVRAGDTLSSIARSFGTTVNAISQANGIVNPNLIFSGQVIVIPSSGIAPTAIPATQPPIIVPTTPPVVGPTIYIVQTGDNLYRISLRFGVSVSDLIRANGIANANILFAGQQLIIP